MTREEPAFWSYQDLALFLGLAPLSLVTGSLVGKILVRAFGPAAPPKALELLPGQFIGYGLLYTALYAIFKFHYRQPFWKAMRWERPPWPWISVFSLGAALAIAIAMLGAALKIPDVPSPMKDLLAEPMSLALVMAFGVTLGPLCEELAFRGLMQPLLVRSLGVVPGILIPALGFGLLHLPQYGSWRHAMLISLAGAGFGWMRYVSQSTAAATVMHCGYNTFLFTGFVLGKGLTNAW